MSTVHGLRAAWRRLRRVHAETTEAWERLWLLNHPWEEDYLHWAPDGELHGRLAPPADRQQHSVTSSGWCPGPVPVEGLGQSPPSPPSCGARRPS